MDGKRNFFLAQRLISGDSKAYDFLMGFYYQSLCGYAQSLCHDHALAEDIVQNVFVTIWTNRKNINPKLSIKSYLYKSVYNEFINQYRKNKPVIYLEKKYFEAIDLIVDIEPTELDNLIKLMNAEIENLPAKCREIFLMNKKEGLTHTEISEYLNISIKTVEGHITRAFKILTEKMGAKMEAVLFLLFNFNKQIHHSS
ncbi:RNA polymerase sigma factor [Arenibacter sp. ARW7G5Y1]|uniref:RNA polymerase sigma factor n=1 Tax=Arenibacter sp. ARW7G5Y1 TaxID=2135619 RepID=UPI000D773D0E|nr:RNA polymerase sigma-70 factor [Arenibacter sp. ARW7G5Y1]PXX24014.1 RNA polymerase sigma-70 factor (ECF subfamily) [Arenibacter sp. ARW7G5Y1]|tara:strand:+ start:64720 stop:65313 length:594 start_codon:yes stop_codon:yes gene_type:complete